MTADGTLVERVVRKVLERLAGPIVPLEASGRHLHLDRAAVEALFGPGYRLTRVRELSQPGQFVCAERVRVTGPRGSLENVVVLGPERGESQLELSRTDAVALGVDAPVRLSGNTAGAPGIRLAGPRGEMEIRRGVIVAARHIHMTPEDARRYGLRDGQVVSVRVSGERAVTFHGVALRVSPDFATDMHIDYDEANACGFRKGMVGYVIPGGD